MQTTALAFDLGASNGRAVLGTYDGERIITEEIHRFENIPVFMNGTLYWDMPRLFYEIKQGIIKAARIGFDSIGIDTWGVDFALIGKDGHMLENPVHYRDTRTDGVSGAVFSQITKERFYQITGAQFMPINTVFQLYSLKNRRPHILQNADKLLMMPDFINYLLTGEITAEISSVSTTQMLDISTMNWSEEIINTLGLPRIIFPEVTGNGGILGELRCDIIKELNIPSNRIPRVVSISGHDSGSAAAAVPSGDKDFVYISCGTWSILGTELDKPIITEKSAAYNFANEIGYNNKIQFIKNITGLWLIQETRRQLRREGKDYTYAELEEMAEGAKPFPCRIDPDAPEFAAGGDIPNIIREYCKKTNQHPPETIGAVIRCIYESLAEKYRAALAELSTCTGKEYDKIYIIGGGANSAMLCRLTAAATGRRVIVGPAEAAALGNIAAQFTALGAIKDLSSARAVIGGLCEKNEI